METNLASSNQITSTEIKSMYYQLNAKPDSDIQLLEGVRKVDISHIHDLANRVKNKLVNHDVDTYLLSINITFGKGKIKDYVGESNFTKEDRDLINYPTKSISCVRDIQIKLPHYQLPQRHTLKLRIGDQLSPKERFELIFNNDNYSKVKIGHANSVVSIDYINQVIANELIEIVTCRYDGLTEIEDSKFFQ